MAVKRGQDGLSDRQRAFVREKRADPTAPLWVIAQRAGFEGDQHTLHTTVTRLMKTQAVLVALFAPATPAELAAREVDDTTLKSEIKSRWRSIVRSPTASNGDAINAGDKLMRTIPGGYVPTEMDVRSRVTLESLLTEAGLDPESLKTAALPPHEEAHDAQGQTADQ